jgi:lysophospholipase L1-like esterase
MRKTYILLLLILFAGGFFELNAQPAPAPFLNDIQAFKKQDSVKFPHRNAILFIGSSSFTNWVDVQNYFPDYQIINRGFGGSTLPDLIRYANDIIFPYHPKQIIIYCGENDLASSDSISANRVYRRFQDLFTLVRKKLPAVPIAYISMKPSPSRQSLMPKMQQGNKLIRDFLKKKRKTAFIDVYRLMIDNNGNPRAELFKSDQLHMNEKGYAIWKKAILPYLLKD